jgi:hypothetical protein
MLKLVVAAFMVIGFVACGSAENTAESSAAVNAHAKSIGRANCGAGSSTAAMHRADAGNQGKGAGSQDDMHESDAGANHEAEPCGT